MKVFALLPPLLLFPLMAQTVCAPTPAYSPCDIVFDLNDQEMAAHPTPYASVLLEAEFRSPHYRTYLMPGFWDGGRRMIVRFTPTEAGQWAFRVSSNIARFDGKEGSASATASDSPGFIMPRNVHHWSYTEGNKPHLWMGDTCYPFAFLDRALFEKIVDTRARQKFNHLRGVITGLQESQQKIAFEAADQPNPDFFRELDARIQYMNRKGIIADLVLGSDHNQLVKQFPQREQRDRYVRYLVAHYAPMNITWQGVQEFEGYPDGRGVLREMGQLLAKLDPYKHPRSTHTYTTSSPLLGDGWMNYVVYQSSNDQLGAIEHQLYTVPFVNAEFAYEDTGAGKKLPHHVDTDTFRRRLWNASMDGQYITFGNTGTYGGKFPVDAKYLESPGAKQMTVWYDFFAGTRHWELEPYFDVEGGRALALSPGGEEEEAVEYIVYVEKPQKPVEILVEKHKYEVSWLNPITGERVKEKDCKADRCSATPPDNSHDWVLHVERQGKKAGMRSYKFESRPVAVQEVEQNPQKVPFEVAEPAGDTFSVAQPPKYAVKVTRDSPATRNMMYLWTGDVAADGQGFRVLGTGPSGTFKFPSGTATNFPAVLNVRINALNSKGKVYATYKVYQLGR